MSSEEKDLLKRCTDQIEGKLQWGDSSGWSNSDYEDLSNHIFEKTQVKLSISTLKRIWGKVKYDNSFNKSTLNALAQYIGFENWRTFSGDRSSESNVEQVEPQDQEENIATTAYKKKGKILNKRTVKSLVFASIGTLMLVAFLFSFRKEDPTQANEDSHYTRINVAKATFKAKKTADNLPNSVVFTFDVSAYGVDTAIIQQNWDPRRQEKVSAKNNIHTSIYYYPGNFNARLIVNKEVVKTDRVYIKTNGWKGIIVNEPIPIYLSEKEIFKNGAIGVDSKIFKDKINSTVFNDRWVNFYNVRAFGGVKSSNFRLETELLNTSDPEESICRKVNVYILFNGGAIIIPLSDKGCVSALELMTGKEQVSGKDVDLSEFGCDFNKPQKLSCEVVGSKLSIALNNVTIFSSFSDIEEEIIGLCFAFEGTGEIRNVKLGEARKFPMYYENFRLN